MGGLLGGAKGMLATSQIKGAGRSWPLFLRLCQGPQFMPSLLVHALTHSVEANLRLRNSRSVYNTRI